MNVSFTLEELEALVLRANLVAAASENPTLARAYQRLADQADVLHALELRERRLPQPEAPASAFEEVLDDTEALETSEQPSDRDAMLRRPGFRVRPKVGSPKCPVCQEPQWKTTSGWVCSKGHGF